MKLTKRKEIFDSDFCDSTQETFSKVPRWKWPAVAHFVCTPYAIHLCQILEDIYRRFPIEEKKEKIKTKLRSDNNVDFLGRQVGSNLYMLHSNWTKKKIKIACSM